MWETEYAREPINYRLFFLKMLKKIWMLPLSALAGGLIIGGIYYVVNMVIGDGYIYRARTIYHIEYAQDGDGVEKEYYNYFTWEELANTEYFVDGMYNAFGGQLSKEDIINNTNARVESDYRYLYTKSDSTDKAQALKMEEEMQKLVLAFPNQRTEIESIEIVDPASELSIEDVSLIFIGRAVLVGAIIGLLVFLVFRVCYECVDTSIYLPSTLEKRYHIPSLGAPCMKEYEENCKTILGEKKVTRISVDDVDFDGKSENKISIGKMESLKDAEAVVITVKAAAHNGKKLERLLEQLARLNISVTAFDVADADEWLIKTYYKA